MTTTHRLPDVVLPVQATTTRGELVRIRAFGPADQRVDSSSAFDDWGPFDMEPDEAAEALSLIEVRPAADPHAPWVTVGDMSWHVEMHGPTLASRALSLGVGLAPHARGRGIGSVAQSLAAAALHRAGIHRVQAWTDPDNVAELRALERAGFVREGVARQAQVRADGRHDLVLCSCLPGEPRTLPE